jgi:hypothetical protein
MTTCSIECCEKPAYCKTFCHAHYGRFKRHGHPLRGGTPRAAPGEPARWLYDHTDHQGSDCLPWPFAKNIDGYGLVYLDGTQMIASRMMCILAHGAPSEPAFQAAHSCGNGHLGCVNPLHLRWATPSENQAERIDHGTDSRGSGNGRAKLTEADVIEIREVFATGEFSKKEIAAECGVTPSLIGSIIKRKAWTHI